MQLTINIPEQGNVARFLDVIKKIDYVEVVAVRENADEIIPEHRVLLEKRLERIKNGDTSFKKWDLIKKRYEVEGL